MQSTITLVASPPEMKSRVMGTLSICIGCSPVGILYLGQFAATLPPTDAILLSAGQGLVAIALVTLLVPAFRRPFPPRPEG
jgi:putative Ca2+/H+ antiporter (TMEM165/GDT1 family)